MKEPGHLKYLDIEENDFLWGLTVSSIGCQSVQPYEFYPPNHHPKGYNFSPQRGRVLDEYQLIYITRGRGTFQSKCSGLEELPLSEGSMFLLFPGEWHNYMPDKRSGWNEYWVGFKGSVIDHRIENGFFDKSNPVFKVGIDGQIVDLYRQIIRIADRRRKGYQQLMAGCVNMLLAIAYAQESSCGEGDQEKDRQLIEKAKVMIRDNYLEIRPQTIAEMLNVSYSSFRKIFKQQTGTAPAQFIADVKMQKSKELLAQTYLSIKEVAYSTGFDNQEYFFIAFKKKNGITPTEYRKTYGRG